MENFPERLRRLRKEKHGKKSMQITSELAGLYSDAIRRYENGEVDDPGCKALEKLADYYGVTMDYLWRGKN